MTRKEAIKLLSQMFLIQFTVEEHNALGMAIDALQAEPQRHGEWEQHDGCVLCKDDDTYFYTCSCCKMAITEAERGLFNYCPNCGAKMDKESEVEE